MSKKSSTTSLAPWRILLPVSIGTALSLLGDSALYTILPTHTVEAGVALTGVGLLLSANRWIRLISNGIVGRFIDRIGRKTIFVAALFLGALSTAIYALTPGYWLFVASRVLWGISWSGIWIGGNAIVLNTGQPERRGRYVGIYNVAYLIGSGTGALLGGTLADLIGYQNTLMIHALGQAAGATIALLFLPNSVSQIEPVLLNEDKRPTAPKPSPAAPAVSYQSLVTVLAILGVSRLVLSGMVIPTFGLFLTERFGSDVLIFGRSYGITTVNGFVLSLATYISLFTASAAGELSDRWHSRWRVAFISLLIGIVGVAMLALVQAWWAVTGLLLLNLATGSCIALSTMLIGDLSTTNQQGRSLGMLFNIGDLASAAGPLIVFQLIPFIPLTTLYSVGALLFGLAAIGTFRHIQQETQPQST